MPPFKVSAPLPPWIRSRPFPPLQRVIAASPAQEILPGFPQEQVVGAVSAELVGAPASDESFDIAGDVVAFTGTAIVRQIVERDDVRRPVGMIHVAAERDEVAHRIDARTAEEVVVTRATIDHGVIAGTAMERAGSPTAPRSWSLPRSPKTVFRAPGVSPGNSSAVPPVRRSPPAPP